MQKLSHGLDQGLHLELALIQQMLVVSAEVRIEAHSDQGEHEQRATQMTIAGLADPWFLVDRTARGMLPWIQSHRSHPLADVQIGRKGRQSVNPRGKAADFEKHEVCATRCATSLQGLPA
jgi:hypothetical protein